VQEKKNNRLTPLGRGPGLLGKTSRKKTEKNSKAGGGERGDDPEYWETPRCSSVLVGWIPAQTRQGGGEKKRKKKLGEATKGKNFLEVASCYIKTNWEKGGKQRRLKTTTNRGKEEKYIKKGRIQKEVFQENWEGGEGKERGGLPPGNCHGRTRSGGT